MVSIPYAPTVNIDAPAFLRSIKREAVVDENEPPALPKFIRRPVPVKAEESWKSLRSAAVVMVEE
jgi:hypothetical protein